MHRSGTSFVARVCSLLGLFLGPEEALLPPAPDNPKGFWEHEGLMRLSVEVLEALGRTSAEPRLPFPSRWEEEPAVCNLLPKARELTGFLREKQPWGWKDPRLCLTLPFWERALGQLRAVFVFRQPLAVAHSLKKRGGFTLEKGLVLWAQYVYSALSHLRGKPFVMVQFERCFRDLEATVLRLAGFLQLSPTPEIFEAVRQFRDETLWHHRQALSPGKALQKQFSRVFLAFRILKAVYHTPASGFWACHAIPVLLRPLALGGAGEEKN